MLKCNHIHIHIHLGVATQRPLWFFSNIVDTYFHVNSPYLVGIWVSSRHTHFSFASLNFSEQEVSYFGFCVFLSVFSRTKLWNTLPRGVHHIHTKCGQHDIIALTHNYELILISWNGMAMVSLRINMECCPNRKIMY